jgi:hypothetical protein
MFLSTMSKVREEQIVLAHLQRLRLPQNHASLGAPAAADNGTQSNFPYQPSSGAPSFRSAGNQTGQEMERML